MKYWLIILSLFVSSAQAQTYIELPTLREIKSQLDEKHLAEKIHFEYDAVEVMADPGDQVAIWNNSGIIQCWHRFDQSKAVVLPLGFYISGIYHLGFRNEQGKKNVISFQLTYDSGQR